MHQEVVLPWAAVGALPGEVAYCFHILSLGACAHNPVQWSISCLVCKHVAQAAEDALLGEMAAVKADMERRQKREKRRKLEQKKKSRIRAAQAAAGKTKPPLCLPSMWCP